MTTRNLFAVLAAIFCSVIVASGQTDIWAAAMSEVSVPKFTGAELPESPSQHQPWQSPATDLPTNLVSSINLLFDTGMADPRGGDYREYETAIGDAKTFKAHGWAFTNRNHQSFAISWSGLVYPALHVGEKADLRHDVDALVHDDEVWRASTPSSRFGHFRLITDPNEGWMMSETNMAPLKVAMLLRLGETNLASQYWNSWQLAKVANQSSQEQKDPFYMLARDWTWELFNRAVWAHERGDDLLSVADCRKLNAVSPKLDVEARQRGFTPAPTLDSSGQVQTNLNDPIFNFLAGAPELLVDEERRVKEPPHQTALQKGLATFPNKSARITALISDLDQVKQWRFGMNWDPIIKALVEQGEDAVDPLLDCVEHDQRLTRAAGFRRDYPNYQHLLTVSNAAQVALSQILTVSFATSAEYRAYWNKYKNLPRVERWYQTLNDDKAGRQQWREVAMDILGRTDGTNLYLWRNAPRPNATNHYIYVADSLRTHHSPSVSDLLARRALEIAPTNYLSSQDCWKFDDAANLGLMLAEWDPKAASPALAKIIQRCPALFPKAQKHWGSGCNVVPQGLAQLADAMAALGDTSGLDLYAQWIETQSFDDLKDSLPRVLQPLGLFPNHPSIQAASAKLFLPGHHEWLDDVRFNSPLKTRLLLNSQFRARILEALADKTPYGTIVFTKSREYEMKTKTSSGGGIMPVDSFAPKIGETITFRVCDFTAHNLSRIGDLPKLEIYWPKEKRDEAVASIIEFLKTNGDHLKLIYVSWPPDEDE